MTSQEFVAAVERIVYRSAVDGTIETLRQPAGRSPRVRALELQRWYTALDAEDQRMLAAVVRDAAHSAVFQFFCVLDGVVAFDDPPHAELRLVARDPDGTESVLNEPAVDLHDEFNALVHPPSEPWPPSDASA